MFIIVASIRILLTIISPATAAPAPAPAQTPTGKSKKPVSKDSKKPKKKPFKPGRAKRPAKTTEELDAEMAEYFSSNNNTNDTADIPA